MFLRRFAQRYRVISIVLQREGFKAYDIYCSNHGRAEEVTRDILNMTSLKSVTEVRKTFVCFDVTSNHVITM